MYLLLVHIQHGKLSNKELNNSLNNCKIYLYLKLFCQIFDEYYLEILFRQICCVMANHLSAGIVNFREFVMTLLHPFHNLSIGVLFLLARNITCLMIVVSERH